MRKYDNTRRIRKTEESIETLIELHHKGFSDEKIAERLKCSISTVERKRSKERLPKNSVDPCNWFFDEPYVSKIQEFYNNGWSDIKIVKRLRKEGIDISLSNIQHWRKLNYLQEGNKQIIESSEVKGKDSLFCDTAFLKKFFGKDLETSNGCK